MKNSFLKISGVFLLFQIMTFQVFGQDFRGAAPKAGPAPKIEMGKAFETTLPNGLKVISVENRKLPRVSFQIFVDVPPSIEGDKTGAASLAGQLLSRGTSTKTKAEIDEAIDFVGANLSSSSSGINGSCLSRHKEVVLENMADVLLNPSFPEEEFEKIKKQTLSGLAQNKEDADAIARNVGTVLRFGKDHPYGEIETEETIKNVTLEDCKAFYAKYFKPNSSYLIMVGDISPKEVEALATKYFAKWTKGDVPAAEWKDVKKPAETSVNFVDKTGAVQSVISITYPVDLKPGSADAIKGSFMNTLLGGGGTQTRLNANIREDKGYSYGVYSRLRTDKYMGNFSAGGSVRNEVTDSSLVEFLYEINRLRDELISDQDLMQTKSIMTGSFARQLENPQTVARFALNRARYNLPEDYYPTYLEKLNAITKEDIQMVAQKYLQPKNAHILVVGSKDEVAEKLGTFAASGKVNFYNKQGEPISDSGAEIPEGVTAETILSDYIQAIGGKKAVMAVKTSKTVMEASMMGMVITSTSYLKYPSKMYTEVAMGGAVMQTMVFDGEKGSMSAQGQTIPYKEEDNAKNKIASNPVPELMYAESGVAVELKGIEDVNGKNAYKMVITYPSGQKQTDYFDQETSLKIRTIATEMGQTQTVDMSDYQMVDSVKVPHTVTISGGGIPMPMEMKIKSIEYNIEVEDAKFQF